MRERVSSVSAVRALARSATVCAATAIAIAAVLLAALDIAGAAEKMPPSVAVPEEPADGPQVAVRPSDGAVQVQPTARQFGWPNRPDVSPACAKQLDELYGGLMGDRTPAASPPVSDADHQRSST